MESRSLSFEHGGPIDGLAVSGDGKRLATGGAGSGRVLKIWNLDKPGEVKNVKPAVEIKGVSRPQAWFGADRIAAANREGAGVYDLAKKDWVAFAQGVGDEWAVSPDERLIASAGAAALRIRVWDLTSGKQIHSENDAFPDVAFLAPTPDGKSLFVIAGDAAYLWPMGEREAIAAGQLPSKAIVAASGGGRLAVATPGEVLIYDGFDPSKGLGPSPSRTLKEQAAGPRAVAVSPDGRRVAYSGEAARIIVADAVTGKTIRVLPVETIGLGLEFTPDGSKLAVVGRDAFLRLWPIDAAGGEDSDVWRVRLQRAPRAAVAFSPDGAMVAATSATMIKVVNTATGEQVAQLDRRDIDDGVFQHVSFSPDSRLIVTGSAGLSGAVHVYELETRTLIRRFTTSLGSIHRLTVLPGGSRAVSAGAEEVITLWDLTGRQSKAAPSTDELAAAWADLDALDGAKGDPALRTLVAGGVNGVRTVAAGIDSVMANQRLIAGLVKDLASEELAVREAATKGLLAGGYPALLAVEGRRGARDAGGGPRSRRRDRQATRGQGLHHPCTRNRGRQPAVRPRGPRPRGHRRRGCASTDRTDRIHHRKRRQGKRRRPDRAQANAKVTSPEGSQPGCTLASLHPCIFHCRIVPHAPCILERSGRISGGSRPPYGRGERNGESRKE